MHADFLENEVQSNEKNTGPCLSIKLKATCKNSADSEQFGISRPNCHIR